MTMLWPRDSQRRDMDHVFALLQSGALSFAGLLGGVFDPSEAQTIYDRLRGAQGAFMTAAFRW